MNTRQLIVAFCAEGSTDIKFLQSVIEKAIDYCLRNYYQKDTELLQLLQVDNTKGKDNVERSLHASMQSLEKGAEILCIHFDADDKSADNVLRYKIQPILSALHNQSPKVCSPRIVPVIPIRMIESWMMADGDLLRQQLGTSLSMADLKLNKPPESFADPKEAINTAIGIVKQQTRKRFRGELSIVNLYESMGHLTDIDKLLEIPSFQSFINSLHQALAELHICSPS